MLQCAPATSCLPKATGTKAWLASLEAAMAEHGIELVAARARTIEALDGSDWRCSRGRVRASKDRARRLERVAILQPTLKANRPRDAAAGRATEGPHRQDLSVVHRAKGMPAAQSSTGEQKALLLGLVLAHAELIAERRGEPPILLLDEVAAHLDPRRRAALFVRLEGRGQVWMTATEAALFEGIGPAASALPRRAGVLLGSNRPAWRPGWTFFIFLAILHCNTRRFLKRRDRSYHRRRPARASIT